MAPTYDPHSDPKWENHQRNLDGFEAEARRERFLKTASGMLRTALVVLTAASAVRFAYRYVVPPMHSPAPPLNVEAVTRELAAAHKALLDALSRADGVATHVLEASKKQQDELTALRARYDSLKALTAGQEDLARSYRAILAERSWTDRLLDALFGFLLGVTSSLAASWLFTRMSRPPPQAPEPHG